MGHVTKDCTERIEGMERDGGLLLSGLCSGTVLHVRTQNSLYVIEKGDDPRLIVVSGGRYFCHPSRKQFLGSSFGGAMLRPDWIGRGMRMEFANEYAGDPIKTSAVVNFKVIAPCGWFYETPNDDSR